MFVCQQPHDNMKDGMLVNVGIGGQPFLVRHLRTVEEILEASEFLHEGYLSLCDPARARLFVSWEEYFQRVMHTAISPAAGTVVLFSSKNDKSLGYMVLIEDSESRHRRTVMIYAGYSNGRFAAASEASMAYVQRWAKAQGFVELHANSYRINGAAMRLFRKKLGFTPLSVVFKKDL
jgi:hypothetical protein